MNNSLYNSVLYVNLEQLRRNVRTLLGELEGKELIPVLKGNAYGLGLERIGRELAAFEEIHTLAVAQVSEGAALRDAGALTFCGWLAILFLEETICRSGR